MPSQRCMDVEQSAWEPAEEGIPMSGKDQGKDGRVQERSGGVSRGLQVSAGN